MRAEATYYLEITNYDLSKALDEFDEDAKFEKEQEKIFKGLKKGGKNKEMSPLLYLNKWQIIKYYKTLIIRVQEVELTYFLRVLFYPSSCPKV